VIIAR